MVDLIAIFSKCASMCLLLLIVETEMVTAPTHAHHTVIANWVTLCPPDKSESSVRIRVRQTRWPALISIKMPDQGLPAWATSVSNLCYGGLWCHLNPSEVGKMLCPVKQLKLYLRDLGTNLGGRQRLFIHWNWNSTIRDIMRSHISRWIVETVTGVYTGADREYDHATAHEVRALSASWAYNCQVALPDILSAAFGGRQESCEIPIGETWHVLLIGCLLWVQWWSHNKSCFTVEVEQKFLFSAPCI